METKGEYVVVVIARIGVNMVEGHLTDGLSAGS